MTIQKEKLWSLVPTLSKEYLFKPPFSYTVGHPTVLLHKPLRTNGGDLTKKMKLSVNAFKGKYPGKD
jgi:hypothetical protein